MASGHLDPAYMRRRVEDLGRYLGTGGMPGVPETPMDQWWGQPSVRQNFQDVRPDWHGLYPNRVQTEDDDNLHSGDDDDDDDDDDDARRNDEK